jgi:hypothetical protein
LFLFSSGNTCLRTVLAASPILAKGKNKLDVYQKLMVHPSGKFLEMIFQRILNNIEETTK